MKRLMLLVLLLISQPVFTRDLLPQEMNCLKQIREESDFILSRINQVHEEYEGRLKQSGLADFTSGNYSTIGLLDNTIRKQHRNLVRKVKRYPFSYKARITGSSQAGSKRCLAEKLQAEAVGTIHDFELSWREALRLAEQNATYFQQVDGMN